MNKSIYFSTSTDRSGGGGGGNFFRYPSFETSRLMIFLGSPYVIPKFYPNWLALYASTLVASSNAKKSGIHGTHGYRMYPTPPAELTC